jgi:hypothetical protein
VLRRSRSRRSRRAIMTAASAVSSTPSVTAWARYLVPGTRFDRSQLEIATLRGVTANIVSSKCRHGIPTEIAVQRPVTVTCRPGVSTSPITDWRHGVPSCGFHSWRGGCDGNHRLVYGWGIPSMVAVRATRAKARTSSRRRREGVVTSGHGWQRQHWRHGGFVGPHPEVR